MIGGLKPCPFCTSENLEIQLSGPNIWVLCKSCHAVIRDGNNWASGLRPAQPQAQQVLILNLDRELGGVGTAYDMPGPRRAYTFNHQPSNNTIPSRLGSATRSAINSPHGDSVDIGLNLLKALQENGFGVFEIERDIGGAHG